MNLEDLRSALESLDPSTLDPPETGRIGATLVLLTPTEAGLSVTLTRRQPFLSSHPGQISFPGGRVDAGETIEAAALREAEEEIGLDASSVTLLGRLPAFYIPPSRFWMCAVVAVWDAPHPLIPNPDEVESVMTIDLRTLTEPDRWRAVPLSRSGVTWAWQLAPQRLLWGATAVVTGIVLQLLDGGWSGGMTPERLELDRHVKPWEDPESAGVVPAAVEARARLRDVPTRQLSVGEGGALPGHRVAADAVVEALSRLQRRGPGPVVVLVGPGGNGDIGRLIGELLVAAGEPVQVIEVSDVADDTVDAELDVALAGLGQAGVVIDALVGRGVDPPLRAGLARTVSTVAATGASLIAVDLPSGIHPTRGLIGDTVSADVTVALGSIFPAHGAPGAMPFVGDLYLADEDGVLVRVDLVDRPAAWAE